MLWPREEERNCRGCVMIAKVDTRGIFMSQYPFGTWKNPPSRIYPTDEAWLLWWYFWFSRSVISYFLAPWTADHQAPLSVGFSRQEHWSGLPFLPGDLPGSRTESESSASNALAGGFLTTNATWEAQWGMVTQQETWTLTSGDLSLLWGKEQKESRNCSLSCWPMWKAVDSALG